MVAPDSRTFTALRLGGAAFMAIGIVTLAAEIIYWPVIVDRARLASALPAEVWGARGLLGAMMLLSGLWVAVGWGLANRREWARVGIMGVMPISAVVAFNIAPSLLAQATGRERSVFENPVFAAGVALLILLVLVGRWLNRPTVRAACLRPPPPPR
ncbi:MAG TPA: hypothetical protein VGM19_05825 [Armatimonadota bacterium]|jgi:cation transport ATPase